MHSSQKGACPCDLIHIAPVLRGVKPAELINPRGRRTDALLLHANPLRHRHLHASGGSELLLIYDPVLLDEALRDPVAREVLSRYNYPAQAGCRMLLDVLSFRFRTCGFPHEIGLFLGYPPGDVRAFIEEGSRNCLLSGYWKVYSNVEGAREMFRKIDAAREIAAECLRASRSTAQAVFAIKSFGKAVPI